MDKKLVQAEEVSIIEARKSNEQSVFRYEYESRSSLVFAEDQLLCCMSGGASPFDPRAPISASKEKVKSAFSAEKPFTSLENKQETPERKENEPPRDKITLSTVISEVVNKPKQLEQNFQ